MTHGMYMYFSVDCLFSEYQILRILFFSGNSDEQALREDEGPVYYLSRIVWEQWWPGIITV